LVEEEIYDNEMGNTGTLGKLNSSLQRENIYFLGKRYISSTNTDYSAFYR
jgi:hypothetical protein